jgi:hypothetical protein
MRTGWRAFVPCLLAAWGLLLSAPTGVGQQDRVSAPPPPVVSADILDWVPDGLTALRPEASSKTEFTFDRSMLELAGSLAQLDPRERQAVARLNGVAVHLYQFPRPGAYDPGFVNAMRAQYNSIGWKHIVSEEGQPGQGRREGATEPGRTDVWLDMQGASPAGAAILLAGPSNVDLIVVSGDIDTLDLLHLRGHFGIPRFQNGTGPR